MTPGKGLLKRNLDLKNFHQWIPPEAFNPPNVDSIPYE